MIFGRCYAKPDAFGVGPDDGKTISPQGLRPTCRLAGEGTRQVAIAVVTGTCAVER
jgi:hypothetical protein